MATSKNRASGLYRNSLLKKLTNGRIWDTGPALLQQITGLDLGAREVGVNNVSRLSCPGHRGLGQTDPGPDDVSIFVLRTVSAFILYLAIKCLFDRYLR